MNEKSKRLLILSGEVLFWVATLTILFWAFGQSFDIALILGIVFGPVIILARGPYRRLLLGVSGGDGKVDHSLEMEVTEDSETVFKVIMEVLHSIPGKLRITDAKDNEYIEATVARLMNWPGNRITVRLTEDGSRKTAVRINSRPVMSTVWLDGGYNEKYINLFRKSICNNLTTRDADPLQ